ncbi:CoA pyrophosphatase [Dokdonella soli]|uniref:Nudix hydrolase domain-containing protein n=1 Tax=Dokdonella soli TaxID=529810 RepID=A0ABN1IBW9_9GAMM
MMTPPPLEPRDAARLRRAVRSLDDPPVAPGWNAGELTDVFEPGLSRRPAAVLVPFVRRGDALSVLFTRRNEHLRQHAGQVSFPGGGVDAGDADAIAAALRETEEETGIAPALVEPFGYLDCFDTVSGYCVTPVAGFVHGDYSVRLEAAEVDEVFEVPLDFILAPDTLHREHILWRGRERDIFAFEWEGRRIWGATAAILKNLLDRLENT